MSTDKGNKNYWKSINEYNDDNSLKEAKHHEFMNGVTDEFEPDQLSGISRRKFLAVLGASTAFAATACSDYADKGEIVPYTKRPEEILPGIANYYASTCTGCSNSCSTLVKTREGRPIKVDGNPDSPINKGKLCTKGQSSILSLYDPERLQEPLLKGRKISWAKINGEIVTALKTASDSGKEIAVITDEMTSPSYNKILNELSQKYSTLKIYSYKQFNQKTRFDAWEASFGTRVVPSVKFNESKIILALESDFIGKEGNFVENARLFAQGKDVVANKKMSRLYSVEGGMSLTGMNSDYRLRLRPDNQFDFVLALIDEVSARLNKPTNGIPKVTMNSFVAKNNLNEKTVKYLVDDLVENIDTSIVHAGDTLSVELHKAVNVLNSLLSGNKLYDFNNSFVEIRKLTSLNDLKTLAANSELGALIIVDSDPIYHYPNIFEDAFKNVQTKIAIVNSKNDSSAVCDYILPINNALESWGDHQVRSSVVSLQQPVIAPIFNTRQKEAILLSWINDTAEVFDSSYHAYLQSSVKELFYDLQKPSADFSKYWLSVLHDGIIELESEKLSGRLSQFSLEKPAKTTSEYTVHIQESYFVSDGRFANNGWLQEVPHPVSKVTWDNYAAVSPGTAKSLEVENGDVIKLTSGGRVLEIPVMLQPGLADNHFTIETGYGRKVVGDVGLEVGFNANILFDSTFIFGIDQVSKTGKNYKLASTQEHHALDDDFVKDFHKSRHIIQEGTLEEYLTNPEFLKEHKHDVFSITDDIEYKGNKWAMAIDLNKCIGCAACTTSCNVENNVPVVGKDQVENGREMHWMRIDRYYSGTPEEPIPSNQPMLCQHCDNAPCENVCPVNATNHSPDGLNQMAYNRCVGTRYCANNCSFKVRRFNFFDFRDHFENEYYNNDLTQLVNNPEVTVRSRGVMEKCTFCIQRIMDARSEAIKEGRELHTDEVKTACQVACPSEAIVFGDSNDPNSKVAKMRDHNLGYHVLEELNVRPNVTYIAKLRNTHSEEN
ncbi:MAG: TAT-variant-translocated molybdopterin oxidoreductase [Bacteroidetes bacterium]|nr:TAT-variant-translocated molybdopterin oxidoreductase [Bacteroidota bacterium]